MSNVWKCMVGRLSLIVVVARMNRIEPSSDKAYGGNDGHESSRTVARTRAAYRRLERLGQEE